ncbi:Ras-related protein Rab-43 [Oopsacas minuta]|uniref:Ras-related protein Rab-43 n=1 Tax=Oopsacas minuta TaxID=111878 RepID=A0AAV7K3Y5_9METZ|nr:Ras-related protein Rab-43 [Oopsacas minuta]
MFCSSNGAQNSSGKKKGEKWESRVLISLVGGCGVGKSHLIHSYINKNRFRRRYIHTVGVDFKSKIMMLDGNAIQLKVFDFSGTCISDPNFCYQFIRYGNIPAGLILAYDITNHTSFLDVTSWYVQLKSRARTTIPAMLVGMKADQDSRQVDEELVKSFSEQEDILCSTEVSAFDKVGCEFVFATITSLITRKYPNLKDKVKSVSTTNEIASDKLN